MRAPLPDPPVFLQVEVLEGKDAGKQGKVVQVIRQRNWVVLEGLNTVSEDGALRGAQEACPLCHRIRSSLGRQETSCRDSETADLVFQLGLNAPSRGGRAPFHTPGSHIPPFWTALPLCGQDRGFPGNHDPQ